MFPFILNLAYRYTISRLRYMKYLYPYECEKLQLSSPGELQAAIGNDNNLIDSFVY